MDPYFHKALTLRVGARRLTLRSSQELFSAHAIDTGTLRLIRSLERRPPGAGLVPALDPGCGYGALGLAVAELAGPAEPAARAARAGEPAPPAEPGEPGERAEPAGGPVVDLVDRDALAVAYSAANAEAAGLGAAARAYGSLGFDDVDPGGRYALVVANLPGKAPRPVLEELVVGAAHRLQPGGTAAVVVVNPLAPLVTELLVGGAARRAGAEIEHHDQGPEHTVFHYRFTSPPDPPPAESGFDRGLYARAAVRLDLPGGPVTVTTVHGVGEFDQLSYSTVLALELLATGPRPGPGAGVAVVNPGQGHLAIAAIAAADPDGAARGATGGAVHLADRDLLALRATAANLRRAGHRGEIETQHAAAAVPHAPVDLAVLDVRPKEPAAVAAGQVEELLARLRAGGRLIVAGATTPVLRAVGTGRRAHREARRRGHAAVELRAPSRGR